MISEATYVSQAGKSEFFFKILSLSLEICVIFVEKRRKVYLTAVEMISFTRLPIHI